MGVPTSSERSWPTANPHAQSPTRRSAPPTSGDYIHRWPGLWGIKGVRWLCSLNLQLFFWKIPSPPRPQSILLSTCSPWSGQQSLQVKSEQKAPNLQRFILMNEILQSQTQLSPAGAFLPRSASICFYINLNQLAMITIEE